MLLNGLFYNIRKMSVFQLMDLGRNAFWCFMTCDRCTELRQNTTFIKILIDQVNGNATDRFAGF